MVKTVIVKEHIRHIPSKEEKIEKPVRKSPTYDNPTIAEFYRRLGVM